MTWIWKCICFEATCYFFHMQQNDMISGTIEWVVGKWNWEFRIDVILFFQITRSFTPLYFQQILGLLICILSILLFKTKKGKIIIFQVCTILFNFSFQMQYHIWATNAWVAVRVISGHHGCCLILQGQGCPWELQRSHVYRSHYGLHCLHFSGVDSWRIYSSTRIPGTEWQKILWALVYVFERLIILCKNSRFIIVFP